MALTATYDPVLSRIRLAATLLGATAVYAIFDRTTDGVTYTEVRGWFDVAVAAESANLDDYEFPAGIAITYRVRSYNSSDVLQQTFTTVITQDLAGVWVKVVARPFLNRQVVVSEVGEISRAARGGLFAVVGRSFPISISDVRGSRQFNLQLLTATAQEATDLDLLLASGEPVFVHVPSASKVPGGYFAIGDSVQARRLRTSERHIFDLPLTEIAAPGPNVVGANSTWQSVLSAYATWQDVLNAHTTWQDLLELIGDPTEVIVP